MIKHQKEIILLIAFTLFTCLAQAQKFRAIAFFTARQDLAHISFVHEANKSFSEQA